MTLTVLQTGASLVICLAAGAATGQLQFAQGGRPAVLAAVAYAAILCTIAGFLLQNIALTHISAKLVGVVQCLYPICTALTAFFLLGERLSVSGVLGCLLITAAVFCEGAME